MSETIVVGYDGSEGSSRALDAAIESAKAAGGDIVLVAVEYMPVDPGVPSGYNLDLNAMGPLVPQPVLEPPPELKRVIEEGLERIEAGGVSGRYVWGLGEPASTILETAREVGAARIVIGVGHHGFLARFLGDDVEAEVQREAGCEVVVVE